MLLLNLIVEEDLMLEVFQVQLHAGLTVFYCPVTSKSYLLQYVEIHSDIVVLNYMSYFVAMYTDFFKFLKVLLY